MTAVRRRIGALAVWAVSWVLAAAAVVLAATTGLGPDPVPGVFLSSAPVAMQARFDDIGITVALIYGPVSALILARRPHPVGVVLAVHAVGSGLAAFGVQYGLLGTVDPDLPLWGFFAFAAGWGFVPGTFMTAALPILVTRRRLGAVERWLVRVCVVVASAAFFASLTQQSVPEPRNPFAIDIPLYQATLPTVYGALSFTAVAISFASIVVLLIRLRRAHGRARIGIVWLTVGHAFLTASYVALVLPAGLGLPAWVIDFGLIAPVVGQLLYPVAILVVVLGQRLWGVELVVSRLLLWASLTASGVGLYLVVVALLPAALSGDGVAALFVPVVVALALLPLRAWLQRRIDGLIYGEGADPGLLLVRLGRRIGELGEDSLAELAETLRRVLRLGWVQIVTTDDGHRASAGSPSRHAPARVALRAGDELVGELRAQPVGGQRLDRRTIQVLDDIAGLVATVVRLAESSRVLESARAELAAQRTDERRAVRRELHDGLGPALAGIGFGLAAARNLAISDPQRARGLLQELREDVDRRGQDARALADTVSEPSAVTARALRPLLEAMIARFDTAELGVRLDVRAVGAHVDDVSASAVYFIVAEALTNAVRHAGAQEVSIVVSTTGTTVVVDVRDDGTGIAAGAAAGIGMHSMRERAAAVGGALTVSAARPGTLVRAVIPTPTANDLDGDRDDRLS
ncbi:hypothetical protein GCM10009775_23540 [Microbacterium aoyamense]|uniref:histidine kinase n=1 Tax=Microbacterium aoyamense TaxID=344166 RepID=A0ABN2PVR6_9MICO|nr:ATP-binding protein [Microbacterium aoyamense]